MTDSIDMYDSYIRDKKANPDDEEENPSFEDVYPEDVERWRSEQRELNERGNDNE